jgi:hypothetical protein
MEGKDASMIRKNNLASIIVKLICVLMFYTGCGSDGGDGSGSPDPGTEACTNCPCDFFSVPMTAGCWAVDSDQPHFFPFQSPLADIACELRRQGEGRFKGIAVVVFVEQDLTDLSCTIRVFSDTCPVFSVLHTSLDEDTIADCSTCLEAYATALNNGGIGVSGGPPYNCQ